jgi:hypothetical protein
MFTWRSFNTRLQIGQISSASNTPLIMRATSPELSPAMKTSPFLSSSLVRLKGFILFRFALRKNTIARHRD